MGGTTITEAKAWEAVRPDELGSDLGRRPHDLPLWRCAVVEEPYFGRGSFWTPSRAYAAWFARRKAAAYPEHRSLGLYRAEFGVADAAVIYLRHHLGRRDGSAASGAAVVAEVDQLTARGVEWVLTTGEDPLGGEGAWTEAIYVGSGSVAAARAAPAEPDPLP